MVRPSTPVGSISSDARGKLSGGRAVLGRGVPQRDAGGNSKVWDSGGTSMRGPWEFHRAAVPGK